MNLGWALRICISKFSGGGAAAGSSLHLERATGLELLVSIFDVLCIYIDMS